MSKRFHKYNYFVQDNQTEWLFLHVKKRAHKGARLLGIRLVYYVIPFVVYHHDGSNQFQLHYQSVLQL